MFVRRTRTRATGGAEYHTHRLVRSERDGAKVRQRTLLNLGRHFGLERERWPLLLCQRVEELLAGQMELPMDCPPEARAEGHLFITVLACQLVQVLRAALRAKGVDGCWNTLRNILKGQQRVTATFRCADGRVLHVRKATRAEPALRRIYDALGIDPGPEERARPPSSVDKAALRSATCQLQRTQHADSHRLSPHGGKLGLGWFLSVNA